uniref:Xylose-responsive transcription regulator, ROK family n=1 Tax=Loigolactobacillus rennini TaxID=238013 RepID=A0A1K2I917_9LACO|nr:Xylose-responsive transcription regulator, ROK family [Loigolactobacillus rennini]
MIIHKEMTRSNNERYVLREVINHKQISRSQISRNLHLNKVTVSQIVTKLIEHGLLVEVGAGESTLHGGRKPALLSLNPQFGYIININLGYRKLDFLTVSISGKRLAAKTIEVRNNQIISMLKLITAYIDKTKAKQPANLLAISFAIHGIVQADKILYSPFIDMAQQDLKELYTKLYQVPVFLENEANLTAIYERDFAKNFESNCNLISISIHKGIGAGIIMNGQLYTGRHGEAGEIGHTVTYKKIDNGLDLETKIENYCSEDAVIDHIKKRKKFEYVNIELVKEMYLNQDPIVVQIINEFCNYMSRIIYNVIVSFDPDKVILNANLLDKLPELKGKIIGNVHSLVSERTPIDVSRNARYSTLLGANALAVRKLLGLEDLAINFCS